MIDAQLVTAATNHLLAATPTPATPSLPGNAEQAINTVLGWIKYIGLVACVAGLFLVAARMAVSHRHGGGGEHMAGLAYVAGSLVIIGAAGAIIGALG